MGHEACRAPRKAVVFRRGPSTPARFRPCPQRWGGLAGMTACLVLAGCTELFSRDADGEVYRLIEQRQRQVLGATSDARIDGPAARGSDLSATPGDTQPYAFAPHPVGDSIPEAFKRAPAETQPADTAPESLAAPYSSGDSPPPPAAPSPAVAAAEPSTQADPALALGPHSAPPAPVPSTQPATQPARPELALSDALAYTFRHSRDFQTAKEQLYLAALDLTLERHLWTPRFFGEVSTLYSIQQSPTADNQGNVTREPDNTLEAVARAGVRQKLPYGGEIVAQVINSLVRDVSNHITDGETGQTLITADIPLLRGAGRSAFETRYQAERNLIYAIRTFEGYRRNLVVSIAADYFSLQNLRQQINNTQQSVESFSFLAEQTHAQWQGGRRSLLDVQRADQERLKATNDRVDAIAAYETALDAFKLRIGMPVNTPIDVPFPSEPVAPGTENRSAGMDAQEAALRMPAVSAEEAIAAGLKYRLDLLNDLDRIGDAERGVNIAENNLLPDLRATSSVALNTRGEQVGVGHYDDEYGKYQAGLTLNLPLDRKAERNALRRAQVSQNEARREYEQARHTVILQVRSAMRRVEQQQLSLQIQLKNRDLAMQRREAAKDQLDRGLVGNRDLVEAENALLAARNRLSGAQAGLNLAVLQFRRDTGTLRVDDDGRWADSPLPNR